MDEWRLTIKEDTHHTGTNVGPKYLPFPMESSSSDKLLVSTHRVLERAHKREDKHKARRKKIEKYVPLSSTKTHS